MLAFLFRLLISWCCCIIFYTLKRFFRSGTGSAYYRKLSKFRLQYLNEVKKKMCCCALQAHEINIDLFPVFLGQLTLLFLFSS